MNRMLAMLAALVAVFTLAAGSAEAGSRAIDARVRAVSVGVGAASTAGYFAINRWRWRWNAEAAGISQAGAAIGTTLGCAAVSPMVATVVLNRPLKYREAHILIGSCVVPLIGGWLVNEAYNAGWLTAPDEKPVRNVRYRKK